MSPDALPPLDPHVIGSLHDLAGGDPGFVSDLLATYLEQSHGNLIDLRVALAASDARTFARAIHTLAGASLNVGALPVAHTCRAIESDLRAEGGTPDVVHVLSIERELQRVEAAVATVIPFAGCATLTSATA